MPTGQVGYRPALPEIEFALVRDVDNDILAYDPGLAGLRTRFPQPVDQGDRIVFDLDVDLLRLTEDDGRDIEEIGPGGDGAEVGCIERVEKFESFLCPPDILHGTLLNGTNVGLRCGDDIRNLLLGHPLLAIPQHLHLAFGKEPILHSYTFTTQI